MARHEETAEEIFERVRSESRLTATYLLFMGLSGMLATVALLTNSTPVLIGAMLVAPAFPPLAMIPLALARGRWEAAVRALGVEILGLALAIALAGGTTWVITAMGLIPSDEVLVNKDLLEERVRVGWYSFLVAAAAGLAGGVAKFQDRTDTLIGTLASLALIPAGAAAVIAYLGGDPLRAMGAVVLLFINLNLILAMGMVVVLVMRLDKSGGGGETSQSF